MKRIISSLALVAGLCFTTSAFALPSVLIQGGTQGIGLEVVQPVVPMFSVALQGNYFSFNHTFNTTAVTYDGKLRLETIGLLAQWHPFDGAFHIDAGMYYNDNRVSATATQWTPNPGFIPGTEAITFNKLCPYFGIGWLTSGWVKLSLDLGVMYQGAPKLTSTDQCTGATASVCEAQHTQDIANLQSKVSGFHLWPVLRVGVGF